MTTHKYADNKVKINPEELRGQILNWYDKHGRELPWRYKNGEPANPYYVWLSEIMCQQTTVQAVKSYYTKFITKWPTVLNLADASSEEVMEAWAGLGYYARARNLHKCAQTIAYDLKGVFPKTQDELKKLPGIGDYTSAAIAAIVYNEPVTVMDGNIERVMSRIFALKDPLPKARPILKAATSALFESFTMRPGDLAQALMDIGATICIPKTPRCTLCPLQSNCLALKKGIQSTLPVKNKGKRRPQKFGEVYWISNRNNEILFHKRPEKGLLGGMMALPTSSWETMDVPLIRPEIISGLEITPFNNQAIEHVFTHFDLQLSLKTGFYQNPNQIPEGYIWKKPAKMAGSMPTVFKKAFNLFV